MLIKANPNNFLEKDKHMINPIIRNCKHLVMLDYRNRPRFSNTIPIYHHNNIFFVNINSFIQNNSILANNIRKNVYNLLQTSKNILSIGGESYMYTININGDFITNNQMIFNDFIINKKINKSNIKGYIVDYNKYKINDSYDTILMNLSKLNYNIITQLNNKNIKKIIIISCHHNDFWKKTKNLTKYKLSQRIKYLDNKSKYFITVNLFLSTSPSKLMD